MSILCDRRAEIGTRIKPASGTRLEFRLAELFSHKYMKFLILFCSLISVPQSGLASWAMLLAVGSGAVMRVIIEATCRGLTGLPERA